MLQGYSAFIAGFTQPEIEAREEAYDVFVNIPASSVSVAGHATEHFGMGKVHKDIAKFMVAQAESEDSQDSDIVAELQQRTEDLLAGLKKLAVPAEADPDKLVVTPESIRARKMGQSMYVFLENLAAAEGMLQA